MPSAFRLTLSEAALKELASCPRSAELSAKKAEEIAALARAEAPRNKRGSWNMYSRSISVTTYEENGVVHAAVQADRHPLLIEYGWKDKRGRRHAGRHILKGALMKVRES
ncbi:hypothetical protein AB0M57_23975 [Streptomyces sp. NPDC051597]|uniref:hypothetical protein n=1 Tax=Streptomyces sp. NPDC051597 TaxID=3155049 RepID=UPI0034457575